MACAAFGSLNLRLTIINFTGNQGAAWSLYYSFLAWYRSLATVRLERYLRLTIINFTGNQGELGHSIIPSLLGTGRWQLLDLKGQKRCRKIAARCSDA